MILVYCSRQEGASDRITWQTVTWFRAGKWLRKNL